MKRLAPLFSLLVSSHAFGLEVPQWIPLTDGIEAGAKAAIIAHFGDRQVYETLDVRPFQNHSIVGLQVGEKAGAPQILGVVVETEVLAPCDASLCGRDGEGNLKKTWQLCRTRLTHADGRVHGYVPHPGVPEGGPDSNYRAHAAYRAAMPKWNAVLQGCELRDKKFWEEWRLRNPR